jgi:hypothetical protein
VIFDGFLIGKHIFETNSYFVVEHFKNWSYTKWLNNYAFITCPITIFFKWDDFVLFANYYLPFGCKWVSLLTLCDFFKNKKLVGEVQIYGPLIGSL